VEFAFDLQKFVLSEGDIQSDVFVNRGQAGEFNTVISCRTEETAMFPNCQHFFRSNGLDVILGYPREFLPDWRKIEQDTRNFLTCAVQ